MSKQPHPLHLAVAKLFEKTLSSDCYLIRDEACGGNQRIPLFTSKEKSRKTWYCDVDLLVIKDDKIKIIVEIEESNLGPTQICGKYLTSAMARFFIHESNNNASIGMDESVTFIQIMECKKLNVDKTSKFEQWENIEESINQILPVSDSKITKYSLFYGNTSHFSNPEKCRELIELITKECN